jgi:CheY-like chemotaxis protein
MEEINMKKKNETQKQTQTSTLDNNVNPAQATTLAGNRTSDMATTTVLVANHTGHDTLQLTKQETISMVEEQGDSWVFADGRMLDVAGLGEADWNAIGTVQLVPGLVGGDDEIRVAVQIANHTGHSTVLMTQSEAVAKATDTANSWLFIDGQMVDTAGLATADWAQVKTVQIMPQLIGGAHGESQNLLIVGAGGIGSTLLDLLAPAASRCNLNCRITMMDDDLVEANNLGHQRFGNSEIGMLKVDALAQRHNTYPGIEVVARGEALRKADQLTEYDVVVVAVDRPEPRALVHNCDKPWLDLRCRGDGWMLLDSNTDSTIISQLSPPHEPTSCQLEGALEAGNIEFGFAAVAAAGAQWLLQHLRLVEGATTTTPMAQMNSLTMGPLPLPEPSAENPSGQTVEQSSPRLESSSQSSSPPTSQSSEVSA